MDRRSVFFLGAAVVCALLIPIADEKHRWLPLVLAIVYALLSLASWLDARTRARERANVTEPGRGERPG